MKHKWMAASVCTVLLAASLLAGCGAKGGAKNEVTDTKETTEQTAEETTEQTTEENTEQAAEETASKTEEETTAEKDSESAKESDAAPAEDTAGVNQVSTEEQLAGKHHAQIVIKDYGTIELELDADTAPISVTNFVKLAEEDFYDGLTFHRIIDGFMMQGGDPNGDGTGGSGENIKGEFTSNGVDNDLSHLRGVISMARAQAPDSASSQFFIVQTDATYLDGQYAAFGTVTEGMDIVDEICEKAVPVDSNGLIDRAEQPVIETIDILD